VGAARRALRPYGRCARMLGVQGPAAPCAAAGVRPVHAATAPQPSDAHCARPPRHAQTNRYCGKYKNSPSLHHQGTRPRSWRHRRAAYLLPPSPLHPLVQARLAPRTCPPGGCARPKRRGVHTECESATRCRAPPAVAASVLCHKTCSLARAKGGLGTWGWVQTHCPWLGWDLSNDLQPQMLAVHEIISQGRGTQLRAPQLWSPRHAAAGWGLAGPG